MNPKNISKGRRAFLKISLSAVFLPKDTFGLATQYGIEGQIAPELQISQWIDANGNPTMFKLADHKGKFIFLEFWQSWCPGCHSHGFPSLKKISDAFNNNPHFTAAAIQTTFEGFSTNTANKMREIQQQYNLNIVMGHDAGNPEKQRHPKTMIDYRSGGTPWAVLISPTGKVIYNGFSINPESAITFLKKEIKKVEKD